jgi:hypothetical protein
LCHYIKLLISLKKFVLLKNGLRNRPQIFPARHPQQVPPAHAQVVHRFLLQRKLAGASASS